ncbi:MAG: aspartate aminotransferase family protein [Bacteroidales bacterium]|nr:aspartate aminotransferase family protein [Bacteroidales bacterium]
MISQRELFFQHLALPSRKPLALEIVSAEGIYMYDADGKRYTDLVSGVSVSNIGHRHPLVLKAINDQLDKYMHLMVYGKFIQTPQVQFAKKLADHLPESLNSTYFVNSGSEAVEGSLKLAKRFTGRSEIIAFKDAYHGATHGALSVMGEERLKQAFRPLLPNIRFLEFNNKKDLDAITSKTACVIVEPIQAEAGIILPQDDFLKELRKKCNLTGTLLIFDEIQMAFGRTGKLFCFEHYDVVPDILALAKGMGGGMPVGAFISSREIMHSISKNPELGHITTFGGHPVCCAAGLANLNVLTEGSLIEQVHTKGEIFHKALSNHSLIKEIRFKGMMIAVELENEDVANKLVQLFVKNGIVVDQFLFRPQAFRIAPPLVITEEEIAETCDLILKCFNELLLAET